MAGHSEYPQSLDWHIAQGRDEEALAPLLTK